MKSWRSWMCVSLGTWHVFKHLCFVAWREWSPTVMGPLWHHLWPQAKFRYKPRLQTVNTVLTYLRLAYPAVRTELKGLLEFYQTEQKREDADWAQASANLISLHSLLEFFIPVVTLCVLDINIHLSTSFLHLHSKYCCVHHINIQSHASRPTILAVLCKCGTSIP